MKTSTMKSVIAILALLLGSAALAQRGGDLVIAMNGDSEPANLDSQLDPFDSAKVMNNFVADRLVFINPDGARIEPHLATGWEISDDNLTWTFALRQDVHFQDDTPVQRREAVKFNLERILEPRDRQRRGGRDARARSPRSTWSTSTPSASPTSGPGTTSCTRSRPRA